VTTSVLTTRFSALLEGAYSSLIARGYPFDRLTTAEVHYLATALTGLRGSAASELRIGVPRLLEAIANAIDSGSRSADFWTIAELLTAIIDGEDVGAGTRMELEDGGGRWRLEDGSGAWDFG
jgi:hypothetical protein